MQAAPPIAVPFDVAKFTVDTTSGASNCPVRVTVMIADSASFPMYVDELNCIVVAGVAVGDGVGLTVGDGDAHAPNVQLRRWPVLTGGVRPVESHANCLKSVALFCTPTEVILPVCVVPFISPYVKSKGVAPLS